MRPTLVDIFEARRTIAQIVARTPLVESALSPDSGFPVYLKLETLQPIGAFKLRGASNAISRLDPGQKANGVVCCSTGNHGRAVAYAARALGARATVCLSELVPEVKVEAIEALGAKVIRIGRSQDEASAEVDRLVAEEGMINIHPFDDPDVIAGQGTIGLELLEERPEMDTILVPMSGGGLVAGIAIAAKAIKPSIRIVGISMDRGAAMSESLLAGQPVEVTEVPSLADSLGGGIGANNRYTLSLCRELVDEVVLLTESEIYDGMRALFDRDRLVAEGAASVGHGAIVAGKVKLSGPTALIVSGKNVDMNQFDAVVRGMPVQLGDVVVRGSN